jgi:hypothetical protein
MTETKTRVAAPWALGLLLLVALAGCGGGSRDGAPGDAAAADAGVSDVAALDAALADGGGDTTATPADAGGGGDDAPAAADAAADIAADAAADDVPPDAPDVPAGPDVPTTPGGLLLGLPFEYERPARGEPLTDAEVTAFTGVITGLWKDVDYFTWAAETSAGVDVSTGQPDYLIWWHDFAAVKDGDTVTFRASAADGGSHNNAEPTGVVLASALAAHLLAPDDEPARYLTEQYTKSFTACMRGFVYDENDPVDWLIARNIATTNHSFVLPSGKKKVVEYDQWYFPYTGWNADRFRYEHNPIWGDIWVTNKRSKDDLPYWYRVAAWLPYVLELTPDEGVRMAAAEAYDLLQKAARDIVDSGWKIRTKDEDGNIYIPEDQDLASFVAYTAIIPDAECDARLATALLGYGDARGVECGTGQGSIYDTIAATGHYFNYDIINHFHQAAALLALTTGHPEIARPLVEGLALRVERYRDPGSDEPGWEREHWERDVSLFLLRSAALGLPLTAEEAREIVRFHGQTATEYATFPNWDLWDPSVPDGTYSFRDGFHPGNRPTALRAEDAVTLIEYCWSPFRNPAGARFVDCDVVRDPARWGEGRP